MGGFRFAVIVSLCLAAATASMAAIYDLPIRDPDGGVGGPTYLRLPLILLVAFLLDVLPRAAWRARRTPSSLLRRFSEVVAQRWRWEHTRFALLGLGAWYLTYSAFRNLKSFVPFVNQHLWDSTLDKIDRAMFFGHEPADVLHDLFGTGIAAHFFSFIYVAWIVMVPASLAIALVWSRNARAGSWYVTAIAVDWVLGAITYFIVPSLGPIYARPEQFADLAHTANTDLQTQLMVDRHDVLVNPFTTNAVQTIAAFASLHVGITVTMVLMAELLRLPRLLRVFLWVFLALTIVTTVYLGWHYVVDAFGGVVLGVAGVAIAAWGTGNQLRRQSLSAVDSRAA
ncbi:MAG TPA: phosphatase PAP2 family protein [Nocardioidaceae bacterium]|nr:phosphatase PAP2 family protein [Nocardioidaceae bacterium]